MPAVSAALRIDGTAMTSESTDILTSKWDDVINITLLWVAGSEIGNVVLPIFFDGPG
jgi:hypothetical protein